MAKTPATKRDESASGTQRAVDQLVWSACDVLRRSGVTSSIQYVPELTWILFLRVLDERERIEAENAEAVGADYHESLDPPYRWRDWAAPNGEKRQQLTAGAMNAFFAFVNDDLLPYLHGLKRRPRATEKQKIISEIMSGVERVRVDTERNFLDVLDRIPRPSHPNPPTVRAPDKQHTTPRHAPRHAAPRRATHPPPRGFTVRCPHRR